MTGDTPAEFTVLAGDDQIHQGLVFDEDITIALDTASTLESRSQILFAGCTFNGDITVIGDRSGFLRFTEECVFGAGCRITVGEATDGVAEAIAPEDDLIKLLFTGEAPEVKTETACNVLCMNGREVVVDGMTYTQQDFAGHQGFCVATVFYRWGKASCGPGGGRMTAHFRETGLHAVYFAFPYTKRIEKSGENG